VTPVGLLLDRSRRERPHLEWKIRLFAAGAVLGLAGMYLEERWLTGAGIVVLAAGALVRFVPVGIGPKETDEDSDSRDAGGGQV